MKLLTLDRLAGYTKCPECGRTEISEIVIGTQHAHQELGRRESVSFECGHKAVYHPNIQRIEVEQECWRSEKRKNDDNLMEALGKDIAKTIFVSGLSEKSIEYTAQRMQYTCKIGQSISYTLAVMLEQKRKTLHETLNNK